MFVSQETGRECSFHLEAGTTQALGIWGSLAWPELNPHGVGKKSVQQGVVRVGGQEIAVINEVNYVRRDPSLGPGWEAQSGT